MKHPKTYVCTLSLGMFEMQETSNGEWVSAADYATLKSELEELKRQPDPLTAYLYAAELGKDAVKKVKTANAFLTLEVERLKNNCDYLDKKLDEEIVRSASFAGEVQRLTDLITRGASIPDAKRVD